MNERFLEIAKQAGLKFPSETALSPMEQKFAELIVKECTGLLFDESERLSGYSAECDNMRESEETELVSEKCVDLIEMIEKHFGVE